MFIQKRKITAGEEVEVSETFVAPEATDLLFEAEDVAELVAEVTGETVEVSTDGETGSVTFAVGEDEFTVEAEGDEEILEASNKVLRGKRAVSASTKRPVSASTKRTARKVIKK